MMPGHPFLLVELIVRLMPPMTAVSPSFTIMTEVACWC